jgi:hypothetical protein
MGRLVTKAGEMQKQADEARRMASKAVDPRHAKACLNLARDFERLAVELQRLERAVTLNTLRSGGTVKHKGDQ